MGRRKAVCNNDLRQQRGTELDTNHAYKNAAWKQKAKTGMPIFSQLITSCYQQSTSPHTSRLCVVHISWLKNVVSQTMSPNLHLHDSPYVPVIFIAAAAKSLQSCPTLCDPIDSSPPGSPIPGILQARTLEWVSSSLGLHKSLGLWASQVERMVKNPPANAGDAGDRFTPWVGKIPWRRKWQHAPIFLPGKLRGQRSLAGYSPWGRKESGTTERAYTHTPSWGHVFLLKQTPNRQSL